MNRLGASLAVVAVVVIGGPSCRLGQPVLVTASGDKTTPGTIGGIVSSVKGDRVAERGVHAIQSGTSQRFSAVTNVTGGFSIKVPPGDYHLEVDLLPGEKVVKEPGTVHINKSDLDANLEIVIGS
jgi:hypothetical protein